MSTIINLVNAQNTIDEIESFILSGIIKPENKLKELIELNELNDTTRYWKFNERYQLIKEVDNRPSMWPYSVGWHSSTRPSNKVYDYYYHPDGKLDRVTEVHISEGDTIETLHTYSYPNENTISEFYKIDLGELFKFDFQLSQVMNNSSIKESTQIMKNYMGDGYIETIQRLEYLYNNENQLNQKNHYFSVNSYPEHNEPDPMQETLGARATYTYDSQRRLKRIIDIEYTEERTQKLRSDLTFSYNGKSNRIERIYVEYGKNYTPNIFEYNASYKINGDLKSIIVNENRYNYITKR